ncbi:hypothetical protein NUW58_g8647 [Xylaria curta]|uniref:Uncharacterized protein n=1 Tax=Xylaria curta TaxID=42375 RepID=A0ACC1N5G1_9PEZI|nr:hypothetical protein NUW58_g8647 [Xylaria curta]
MPLPISSNIAPARAVAKSRVKRFPISPKPEPESTPAQKAKEETRMKFLQAEKRRRKYRERPPPDAFFLEKALSTQKRPAYPAYDDSPNKRRRVGHGSKSKKLARRAPWEKDTKLKKPLSPPDEPVGTSPREQDPIAAMGRFLDLPTEIRENILRYGLLWPEDINVFCGWSRVYPRSRPRLNLSILYTCRALRDQGLQILFGENTFAYDLRDPLASHGHTDVVLEKVFGNSVVPINEHGHLIRHIRIRIHQSRLHFKEHRESLEKAILKFLPGGGLSRSPNLYTLTLEVPAVCNLYLQTPHSLTRPEEVPVCRYLEKGSKISNALLELRTQWVHVLAWDKFGSCWRTEVDMRYFVKDEQMRLEHATYDKGGTQGRDDDTDS